MERNYIERFKAISDPEAEMRQIERERNQLKQNLQQVNIATEIPLRFHEAMFSDYEFDFKNEAVQFALNPKNDGIMLLTGSVGTGKTHLLCSALHERGLKGMSSGFYFSNRILTQVLHSTRSFSSKRTEEEFLRGFSKVSFLCLDEVGTADNRDEERSFIRQMIALRYDNMLPMMIATNLSSMRFDMFLLGMDVTDARPVDELKKIVAQKSMNDPIMSRYNSIAVKKIMAAESHRGK